MLALAAFLGFFASLFLLVAARAWFQVAHQRERSDQRPELSVHRVRSAASASSIGLGLLGLTVMVAIFGLADLAAL